MTDPADKPAAPTLDQLIRALAMHAALISQHHAKSGLWRRDQLDALDARAAAGGAEVTDEEKLGCFDYDGLNAWTIEVADSNLRRITAFVEDRPQDQYPAAAGSAASEEAP